MRREVAMAAMLSAAGMACAGCGNSLSRDAAKYIKPTIAVMKFENRAPFPMGWDLGTGMRDILVDRLCATQRYYVVERPELGSVMRELQFQNSGATRGQDRAAVGRLKNAKYLIKGTITDFGHVSTQRGFLGLPTLEALGGSQRAVMGLTVYVVDVESGEIVSSESIEESVRAGDLSITAQYRDVALGGSVFYRTPLGRATAKVIGKAVKEITRTIAARPWQPRIALVQDTGTVVINGGRNRRVRSGASYQVYRLGAPIVDPDTGDVIGHRPGTAIGQIQVRDVQRLYSVASIVNGSSRSFQAGQRCRLVSAEQ
ncbi:MAG TPA: CsgG/HfaB family protein [Phycisphaerae bacterium]|nr:CsgG/HfaB family protein [Phycisphaerae bacterium]